MPIQAIAPAPEFINFGTVQGKRRIGLGLLTMAMLGPFLFTIGWQIQQAMIQHQMEERLEREQSHTLTLSSTNIHWAETEKELLIDGRLFDVKEATRNADGSYTFKGLFDEEETALLEIVRKKMSDPDGQRIIAKLLTFQLHTPEPILTTKIPPTRYFKIEFSNYSEQLASATQENTGPPPKA